MLARTLTPLVHRYSLGRSDPALLKDTNLSMLPVSSLGSADLSLFLECVPQVKVELVAAADILCLAGLLVDWVLVGGPDRHLNGHHSAVYGGGGAIIGRVGGRLLVLDALLAAEFAALISQITVKSSVVIGMVPVAPVGPVGPVPAATSASPASYGRPL